MAILEYFRGELGLSGVLLVALTLLLAVRDTIHPYYTWCPI